MEQLIISLLSGAAGGNIVGGVLKNLNLGVLGNSIAGIVGGGLGGQILGGLLGGVQLFIFVFIGCLLLAAVYNKIVAMRHK